jgi:hypothetical protein
MPQDDLEYLEESLDAVSLHGILNLVKVARFRGYLVRRFHSRRFLNGSAHSSISCLMVYHFDRYSGKIYATQLQLAFCIKSRTLVLALSPSPRCAKGEAWEVELPGRGRMYRIPPSVALW